MKPFTAILLGGLSLGASLGCALTTYAQVTNGLVAYYAFNGNGDDSAGQNPLVLSNVVFGPDRYGNPNSCLNFDGDISRWCKSQRIVDSNIVDSFTMTVWAKPAGYLDTSLFVNNPSGSLLLRATHGLVAYGPGHAGVGILAGTNGVAVWEHSDNYMRYPVVVQTSLTNWMQIGILYSNGVPYVFLNGLQAGFGAANPNYHFHPSSGQTVTAQDFSNPTYGGFGLAAWFNANTGNWDLIYPFMGAIDDFRIYNRTLSATEMRQLYAFESASGPQVGLRKSVTPVFSNLLPGLIYQLQVSGQLGIWTNQGSPFTATNPTMTFPQSWNVDNWNQLFFRLQLLP